MKKMFAILALVVFMGSISVSVWAVPSLSTVQTADKDPKKAAATTEKKASSDTEKKDASCADKKDASCAEKKSSCCTDKEKK